MNKVRNLEYIVWSLFAAVSFYLVMGFWKDYNFAASYIESFVLFITFIAIVIYSIETIKLKELQSEQIQISKNEFVYSLLKEFEPLKSKVDLHLIRNCKYKDDFTKLTSAITLPISDAEYIIASDINDVFSYFERVGLAYKMGIINIIFIKRNLSIVFPLFYNHKSIQESLKILREDSPEVWQDMIEMYNEVFAI